MLGHCGSSGGVGFTGSTGLVGTPIALMSELNENHIAFLFSDPNVTLIVSPVAFPTIAPYHLIGELFVSQAPTSNLEPFFTCSFDRVLDIATPLPLSLIDDPWI